MAKSFGLGQHIVLHPINPPTLKAKTLYHLTKDLDGVLKNGLIGQEYSEGGIRFYEKRIYFSLIPYDTFENPDGYLKGRDEVKVEFSKEMVVFRDPEFNDRPQMVYMKIDHIPASLIQATGFKS